MSSALAPLLELRDVDPALIAARSAVDAALRHKALRRSGGPLAAEIGLLSAVASAALEGHDHDLDEVRSGTVTDPVVQGALRVSAALDGLAPRWTSTPRQVLARLHLLAGRGSVTDDELGRPVSGAARVDQLCAVIGDPGGIPALLRAAVVHGELLAVRPFAGPNGVVARAAARLTLIADGLDPRGLIAPEIGHVAREPEYFGTANAFSSGTADGVRSWLKHYCTSVELAAAELSELADAV